ISSTPDSKRGRYSGRGDVALSEVREQTEHWLADYNHQIPHDSLGGLTPAEFRDQHQPQTSSFGWH
ncbi:integrase core domain-containing protein, partial [Xanthomonas vasicola]|uniref:integrase core domain-containing protein n=1 Tax=Xanthomonas vasicola TaxID=56459 RepID=UPI00037830D5